MKYSPDVFYYVLAFNELQFLRWAKEKNIVRSQGKRIYRLEDCEGINFTDPLKELLCLISWDLGVWCNGEMLQACIRLRSRYCVDKGVHNVPAELVEI